MAALEALLLAYPEQLAGYDATGLIWRDGTRMPLSDGLPYKSFEEMLRHGSILDQIRLPYPAGVSAAVLIPQGDPEGPATVPSLIRCTAIAGGVK